MHVEWVAADRPLSEVVAVLKLLPRFPVAVAALLGCVLILAGIAPDSA